MLEEKASEDCAVAAFGRGGGLLAASDDTRQWAGDFPALRQWGYRALTTLIVVRPTYIQLPSMLKA